MALRTATGDMCEAGKPGCEAIGEACAEGVSGCAAGTWPGDSETGACPRAGTLPAWLGGAPSTVAAQPPAVVDPPGLRPTEALPALLKTRFCADAQGRTRVCAPDEVGCGPGHMPDPSAPSSCIPVGAPAGCPPGFVPQPLKGGALIADCAPDPNECGADKFGGVQPAPGVVFVDSNAPSGGDGSRDKPLLDLPAAATKTLAATTIAVAAGTYTSVLFPRSVQLIGACAANVILTGKEPNNAVIYAQGDSASGDIEVGIRSVTIDTSRIGIIAKHKARITLDRVFIKAAADFGIGALGGRIVGSSVVVQDTAVGAKGWRGEGVVVGFGGHLTLRDARLMRNHFAGAWIQDDSGSLTLERVLIADPLLAGTPPAAACIAGTHGNVTLRSVRASGCFSSGIRFEGAGVVASAIGVVIDGAGPPKGPTGGSGAWVSLGGVVTLAGVRIHGSRPLAIAWSSGVSAVGNGVIIDSIGGSDQVPAASGGVLIAKNSQAALRSIRIQNTVNMGAAAEGTGSHLDMSDARISSIRPEKVLKWDGEKVASGGSGGVGIQVGNGATAVLRAVRVTDCRAVGVTVFTKDPVGPPPGPATLVTQDLLVDGTRGTELLPTAGIGIAVEAGNIATVSATRLHGNLTAGIQIAGVNTHFIGRGLLIDATTGTAAGGGQAVLVASGARVRLDGAWLVGNQNTTVGVKGVGARLLASGVRIERTLPGAYGLGIGAAVTGGGELVLQGCDLLDNRVEGILSIGELGTRLRAVGTVVRGTRPGDASGRDGAIKTLEGIGISAFKPDQTVAIVACDVRDNFAAGISIYDASATIDATSVIRTQAAVFENKDTAKSGKTADGVLISQPGVVTIRRSLVRQLDRTGFFFANGGQVTLAASAARTGSFGIAHQGGTKVTLTNNLTTDNTTNSAADAGLFVPPPPATVEF